MSCCNKEKLNINNCNVRITSLPNWCITDLNPAFYDTESRTAIEQTARLYAKMQELICDYNDYIKRLNNYISEFENGIIEDFNVFKNDIIKEFTLFKKQTNEIVQDAINYMKDNLTETANILLNEMIENGELKVLLNYNENTESLNLIVTKESEDINNG